MREVGPYQIGSRSDGPMSCKTRPPLQPFQTFEQMIHGNPPFPRPKNIGQEDRHVPPEVLASFAKSSVNGNGNSDRHAI